MLYFYRINGIVDLTAQPPPLVRQATAPRSSTRVGSATARGFVLAEAGMSGALAQGMVLLSLIAVVALDVAPERCPRTPFSDELRRTLARLAVEDAADGGLQSTPKRRSDRDLLRDFVRAGIRPGTWRAFPIAARRSSPDDMDPGPKYVAGTRVRRFGPVTFRETATDPTSPSGYSKRCLIEATVRGTRRSTELNSSYGCQLTFAADFKRR